MSDILLQVYCIIISGYVNIYVAHFVYYVIC